MNTNNKANTQNGNSGFSKIFFVGLFGKSNQKQINSKKFTSKSKVNLFQILNNLR